MLPGSVALLKALTMVALSAVWCRRAAQFLVCVPEETNVFVCCPKGIFRTSFSVDNDLIGAL